MNELVVDRKTGEIVQPGVDYAETALVLSDGLSYEEWEGVGRVLDRIEGAGQWWRGDWLNYGEGHYGEMYSQALSEEQAKTWRNYKWVSGQFKQLSRRRDNLRFGHHEAVAGLEPSQADKLLKLAEGKKLSVADLRAEVRKQKLAENTPQLPSGKYRVLYADPPWQYVSGDQHSTEEQATVLGTHYDSMSIEELCGLRVAEMAEENAVLFIWVTSPLLRECFDVIGAWGFEYKTSVVWDKRKHNVGNYVSVRHEFLLICTRGSCTPDTDKLLPSVVSVERSEHSVKPEAFRQMIDTMYPKGERVELFARKAVRGWQRWGNGI